MGEVGSSEKISDALFVTEDCKINFAGAYFTNHPHSFHRMQT